MKNLLFVALFLSSFLPAKSPDPIRIGYIGGLTGRNNESSQRSLKALQLIVEQFNQQGGIAGRPVEVLSFDNQSSPVENYAVFKKAQAKNVVALTGVHISNDALILAPLAEKNKVPLVVASATDPKISSGRSYVAQVCFTDVSQGVLMAKYVQNKLKAKKIAVVTDVSDSASSNVAKAFSKVLSVQPDISVTVFSIQTGDQDFTALTQSIKALGKVDTIYISASSIESSFLIHYLAKAGITATLVGTDNWQNQDLAKILGSLGDTKITAFFPAHWHTKLTGAPALKLMKDFEVKYQLKLNSFDADAALSYDAGMVLLSAMKNAGSLKPDAIMNAIHDVKLDGATGPIRFSKGGRPEKSIFLLKLSEGQVSAIDTL